MHWVSSGSLNSSMSRSLKSGRHPGGTMMKLPASVPVVRQPGEVASRLHADNSPSYLTALAHPADQSSDVWSVGSLRVVGPPCN